MMKSTKKFYVVIVTIAIVWLILIACNDGSNAGCSHDWGWEINGVSISKKICSKCGEKTNGAIGDTGPAGGIIFYVNANGFDLHVTEITTVTAYYLEAAPVDEIPSAWGKLGTLIPGVASFNVTETPYPDTIGCGNRDTDLIFYYNEHEGLTDTAVQIIKSNANYGGYTGWFLPSRDELNELYKLYVKKGKGSYGALNATGYFSSTECGFNGAWKQSFNSGDQDVTSKDLSMNIRAIRAFQ